MGLPPAISEDKIAEIRQVADIVTIIGECLPLEKAGQNYLGFCPFHAEKTPSFSVSPTKQFFHCFGCGSGGDVFTFLQKKEGLTFIETVRLLARRYGVVLPAADGSPAQARQVAERQQLYRIHREAGVFFNKALQTTADALSYLSQRRISAPIAAEFSLGYAPDGWEHLARFFNNHGIAAELAVKSGLIAPRSRGTGFYDRFRNRIIFPIYDERARIVAFGGRLLQADAKGPKYLNSPESLIFNKSATLYGLHRAKTACQQNDLVYIVEGYFDLLALHQHGLCHSVATLGTALSTEHVKRLKMLAGRAVLVFDGDAAGIKAARRSLSLFSEIGMAVRILCLPDGHDPDSFVFQHGAKAFQAAAAQALAPLTFMLECAIKQHGFDTEGRLRVVSDLLPALAALNDPVARALYVREAAERLELKESLLSHQVQQALRTSTSTPPRKSPSTSARTRSSREAAGTPDDAQCPHNRMEERILAMMLHHPDILPEVRQRRLLDDFQDDTLQYIGRLILEQPLRVADGTQASAMLNQLFAVTRNNRHQEIISALATQGDSWNYTGCLRLIKQYETCRRRFSSPITQQIKTAEAAGDPRLYKLLAEKQRELQRLRASTDRLR